MLASKPPHKASSGRTDTARRLQAREEQLGKVVTQRLDAQLAWFRSMDPADRQWVSVVAKSGISSFIAWYQDPATPLRGVLDVFRSAPRELVRSVSLQQTLQLLRVVVQVVEERVPDLAQSQEQPELKEAVLVYSREIAFAAADIYARAAEARGSWDARLEAMVIDALVRGDSVDELASRSAAFGWQSQGGVAVLIGRAPRRSAHKSISEIRRAARTWAEDVLVGIHDDRLLIVLGGSDDLGAAALALSHYYGPSDVVVGPEVSSLAEAGTSAASALWALRTASAWQSTPRPVNADDLLPERAIAGDRTAVSALIDDVYAPLAAGSGSLLETVASYLDRGGSLEATGRSLHVHPNTVRYRLKKITGLIGHDPTDSRAAFVIRIALVFGRLSTVGQLSPPHKPAPGS